MDSALTSLAGLRREKRRRGQRRCRCPEHQLRMLSHSTVRVGPGPSSRCSRTSCLRARTAVFSNICSSCKGAEGGCHQSPVISSPPNTPGRVWNPRASPSPIEWVHVAWSRHWREGGGAQGKGHCAWSADLAQRGLLVAQAHNEDAVGLAQAAHGPGCQ